MVVLGFRGPDKMVPDIINQKQKLYKLPQHESVQDCKKQTIIKA